METARFGGPWRPLRSFTVAAGIGFAIGLPLGAVAGKTGTFSGTVTHVSASNIKVQGRDGTTLSFLILPRFHKLFHADGKTTAQMNEIAAGDRVVVDYDQSALGARHADRIVDETAPLKPLKS